MQGTNDENIRKQIQVSWDNVPLIPNYVGHLEIICIKWCKITALAEHCHILVNSIIYKLVTVKISTPPKA